MITQSELKVLRDTLIQDSQLIVDLAKIQKGEQGTEWLKGAIKEVIRDRFGPILTD